MTTEEILLTVMNSLMVVVLIAQIIVIYFSQAINKNREVLFDLVKKMNVRIFNLETQEITRNLKSKIEKIQKGGNGVSGDE